MVEGEADDNKESLETRRGGFDSRPSGSWIYRYVSPSPRMSGYAGGQR